MKPIEDKKLKKHKKENNYAVSNELADILLKNGYTDETEKYFPESFNLIQKKGFIPGSHKRQFNFSETNYIIFDNKNIIIHNPPNHINLLEISKEELFNVLALNHIPQKYYNYFHKEFTVKIRYKDLSDYEKEGINLTGKDKKVLSAANLALEKFIL
jgi:hypothetical protein